MLFYNRMLGAFGQFGAFGTPFAIFLHFWHKQAFVKSVNGKHVAVHPVAHGRHTAAAGILGNFVFVMRKLQIHATTVQVKLFAKVLGAHGRAFQVQLGKPTLQGDFQCMRCSGEAFIQMAKSAGLFFSS